MSTISIILGGCQTLQATPVSAASLTLSVPTDALKLDLQPNNTFAKSSAGTVSVKTDALGGYTLSAKAKSNNELVNGSSKLTSITGNLTEDQYTASGNTNTWGYQPSKINGSANTAFLPGPTTSLFTIEKTSAKNDTANSYNFVIGSKVDSTIPKGTYSNTFVFTATANTVSYSITYNLNDGTWTGTSPQTDNTVENTVTISDAVPTKSNSTFLGWCTAPTTTNTCSDVIVQPGKTITLTNGENNIQLYALWMSAYNPQPTECKGLTSIGQTGTFTDPRDGTTYKIARLKDDKCWMTENLRITGSSSFKSGHSRILNSSDSDLPSGQTYTLPTSATWSDGYTNANSDHVYYANNTSYGAYYTWYTATAGTGTSSMSIDGQNAPGSVCPKGWRLPTGGPDANSDFQLLTKQYPDLAQLVATPIPAFTHAGWLDCRNGRLYHQGGTGDYHSSTVGGDEKKYALSFDSYTINPVNNGRREGGTSVRCVARESTSSGGCFTPDTLVDTPNGLIPIKDISIGTQVYSYDFDNSQIKTTTVIDKYTPNRDDVVKLILDNGIVIQGTYPHIIYDFNLKDWKKIGEFKPGDELLTVDGIKAKVVSNEKVEGSYDVYDFEVNELHNYFIVSPDNKDGGKLLVHNYATGSDTK